MGQYPSELKYVYRTATTGDYRSERVIVMMSLTHAVGIHEIAHTSDVVARPIKWSARDGGGLPALRILALRRRSPHHDSVWSNRQGDPVEHRSDSLSFHELAPRQRQPAAGQHADYHTGDSDCCGEPEGNTEAVQRTARCTPLRRPTPQERAAPETNGV